MSESGRDESPPPRHGEHAGQDASSAAGGGAAALAAPSPTPAAPGSTIATRRSRGLSSAHRHHPGGVGGAGGALAGGGEVTTAVPRRLEVLDLGEGEDVPRATRATLMAQSAAPATALLDADAAAGTATAGDSAGSVPRVEVDGAIDAASSVDHHHHQHHGADTATVRSTHSVVPSETSHVASTVANRLRAIAGVTSVTPNGTDAVTGLRSGPPSEAPGLRNDSIASRGGATAAVTNRSGGGLGGGDNGGRATGGGEEDAAGSDADTTAEMQAAANRKWRSRRKHFFILSSAGRPIFTRWGNEFEFAELFGLLQTLVSMVGTSNEALQRVSMGTHQMHFYSRKELTLVMVCATGESPRSCQQQLRMLELQLLAVLPNANTILEKHPNFDVRQMFAAGDVRVMQNLIRRMNHDAGFMLGAVPVLPLPPAQRDAIHRVLQEHYQGSADDDGSSSDGGSEANADESDTGDHLYSLIFAGGRLAAFVGSAHYPVPTTDMHLLLNFAYSVLTTRGEVWAPICLPNVNDSGYLWAYVNAVRKDVLLVHIATSQFKFSEFSGSTTFIVDRLSDSGQLDAIAQAAATPWPDLPPALARAGLQHLIYIKNEQLCLTQLPAHVCDRSQRKSLFRKYVQLRDQAAGVCTGATPFLVHSDGIETVLVEMSGAVSPTTGLHATQLIALFSPLTPRNDMPAVLAATYRHLQAQEATQLMLRPVTWYSAI